jgi:arsenate reductase
MRAMTKTVLFVCVGNSGRSQMAEAFFNRLSKTWKAISAGTKPDEQIHSYTVLVMKEVGLELGKQKPKLLTHEIMERADRIVAMGCGIDVFPADCLSKVEDWKTEEPYGKPIEKVREIRDEIDKRVQRLIAELT